MRFWLGWAQDVAGDHAAAQESWRQARSELEPFLMGQPENYDLIGDLALTNMGLGDKEAALSLSERGIACRLRKTLVTGAAPIETLARVAAQTGEHDRAIAALQQVLSIPGTGALDKYLPLTPALRSTRCLIRFGAIRAFKSLPPRLRRSRGQLLSMTKREIPETRQE